jgi:GNAT superfamily N-acetyltransferase
VTVTGTRIAAALAEAGSPLPDGHRLFTLADRTDLADEVERFGSSVWPELMLYDAVADRCWPHMQTDWPEYQLALLDARGSMAAVARSAPLSWDGTLEDLPRGWDAQFSRSVDDLELGRAPGTLGAIMIVADPARQGDGLGSLMVAALRTLARSHRLRSLVACARPTLLERYPLTPIEEYALWTREDRLPFDPWLRIHVRLGGCLSRPEPASMRIDGSVEQWTSWTGMAFPASGRYVVPGACAPLTIDRDAGTGTYLDPNVWVIHDLA